MVVVIIFIGYMQIQYPTIMAKSERVTNTGLPEDQHVGQQRSIEIMSVYYKKEVINGSTFVYREDTVNGTKKKAWTVDGHPVDADEYEEAILNAEKEVRRKERRKEEEQRVHQQLLHHQVLIMLNKKLLTIKIADIEVWLQKLHDYALEQFLVFNDSTYASPEEFDQLSNECIPKVHSLILQGEDECDVGELLHWVNKLDKVPDQLCNLFYASVNNAIAACDDTKMLKKLLDVVSHA